jgi:hypothetical protein
MQLGRLISCVCLFVLAVATASSAAVPQDEMTVRVTYAKATLANEIDRMKHELMRNQPDLEDSEHLHFAVSQIRLGSVNEISNLSIGSLVTKPSGMVLDGGLGMAEIPGNDRQLTSGKSLKLAGWKVAPYLSEDWNLSLSEALSNMDIQYTRFASFQVTVTFMGQQRQYSALFLFGADASGKERVFGIDHILGMNLINELLKAPIDKTLVDLQNKFSDRRSVKRLLHSIQPENGCEADSKSQFCCNAASGHCGLRGILPVSAPAARTSPFLGLQAANPLASAASSSSCTASCSTFNSNENQPAATAAGDNRDHLWGQHSGSGSFQGSCTYNGTELPCIPSCHVHVYTPSSSDSGLPSSWCHVTSSNWAFQDGQNSCVAQIGWGAGSCPFCLCGVTITVGTESQGSSASVSATGEVIWSGASSGPHNWTCNTIPR